MSKKFKVIGIAALLALTTIGTPLYAQDANVDVSTDAGEPVISTTIVEGEVNEEIQNIVTEAVAEVLAEEGVDVAEDGTLTVSESSSSSTQSGSSYTEPTQSDKEKMKARIDRIVALLKQLMQKDQTNSSEQTPEQTPEQAK